MKLKKTLALALMLTAMVFACSFAASAATEAVEVFVTIANGEIMLAQEPVAVTDIDADGALTINDALYCAHEVKFEGGAAAGYGSADSEWGLSLTKLWGVDNGGSYSYYVNNASALSLSDPVRNGDYISAFAFTDLTSWTDTYCYFDVNTVSANAGETVTLKLVAAGYDADWNPVTVPVEGAKIVIDGKDTGVVTDAEGTAAVTLSGSGRQVITAASDSAVLVPPVCVAQVEGKLPISTICIAAGVVCCVVACVLGVIIKKKNEK